MSSQSKSPTKKRQGSFVARMSRRGSETPGMRFNSFGEPIIVDENADAEQQDRDAGFVKKPKPQFKGYKKIISDHKNEPNGTGRKTKLINPMDVNPKTGSEILQLNRKLGMHKSSGAQSQAGFYVHPSHRGTHYMRKRAQRKIARKRIDGTVVGGNVFVPYGPEGVETVEVNQYEDNTKELDYNNEAHLRGERGMASAGTLNGDAAFGGQYFSDGALDPVCRGCNGAGGDGSGQPGRTCASCGMAGGPTCKGCHGAGGNPGGALGQACNLCGMIAGAGVAGALAGGNSSGYDSGGNPMAVGGRYQRDGILKVRYRTGGGNAGTEPQYSEAYDSDGNQAPPGKYDRKYFKYDSRGKLKKKKKSRSAKTGIGGMRKKAKRTVGSGYETGSQSTQTKQKALLDYYKMAEIDDVVTCTKVCAEAENDWVLRDPFSDDEDDPNIVKNLSYQKVKLHQYLNHPRNRGTREKFRWCSADISYLPCCCSNTHKSPEWVTPVAKEVGLGPTLFLLQQKAFAWLFLALFLINLPLMFFYQSGGIIPDPPVNIDVNLAKINITENETNSTSSGQITDELALFSLGNLGTSEYTCANFNFARNNNTFIFNCNYGTMREFTSFGIQKIDNQTCETLPGIYIGENNAIKDLQYDCDFERGLRDVGKERLMKQYEELCYDQQYCELPIKYNWFTQRCRDRLDYYSANSRYPDYAFFREWDYYKRDGRVREPIIFGVALCVSDNLYSPLSGERLNFTKAQFSYILLVFDAMVVLLTIWFINCLHVRMRQYADEFDKQATEMKDFSVEFTNLPYDHEYGGKESLLQCALWCHIEKVVKERMMEKADLMNDNELKATIEADKFWEISDITFAKSDTRETELLRSLDDVDRQKQTKIKAAQDASAKGADVGSQSQAIVDLIRKYKELKAEFIHIQEDKLYHKWEITETNGRTESDCTINRSFVTFRSMRGKQVAEEVFGQTKKRQKIRGDFQEYFYGRPLNPVGCVRAESLIWDHLHYTPCSRCCRTTCVNIFATILILLCFMLMIWFSDWEANLKSGAGLDTICPEKPMDAEIAYFDWDKDTRQRQGFMHCYCIRLYNKNGGDVSEALETFQKWEPSLTPAGGENQQPCAEWKWIYDKKMWIIILAGAMIGIINSICVVIFELVVFFEKYPTYEQQTQAQYTRITIIQYLNIACILLLAEFNLNKKDLGFGLPVLLGKHKDFDTLWYKDIGVKMTVAMLINSFAPLFSPLSLPFVDMALRYWDRGCFKHLKIKHNEDDRKAAEEAKLKAAGGNQKPKKEEPAEEAEAAEEGGATEEVLRNTPRTNKVFKEDKQLEGGEYDEEVYGQEGEYGEEAPPADEGPVIDEDEPQTKIIFQDDLNDSYSGKLAKVFYMYSWFFTNMLVYFTFAGGIPILWGFGALFYFLSYLVYKFLFIDYHCITHGFDSHIPLLSIGMIKWCLLLHITFVLFMYTDKRLLTPPNYTPEQHYRPPFEAPNVFFRRRFDTMTNFSVWVYVVIMLAIFFIYRCLIVPIMMCVAYRKPKSIGYDDETDRLDHSDDIYKEYSIKWLRNLYVRANKDWEIFRTMLNSLSYDQEKLTDDGALFFKQKLRTRLANIEETIDIHLNSMGGLEFNTDKTYIYKLAILAANEEKIRQKDPTCQRMVDSIQSYYIYASIDYAKINLVLKRIDRELLELNYLAKDAPVYC